ncbi:hypothetical protein [Streptomyces sp. RKAG293]|uniref:hypothetical protein n=1 Tax=Streptomyces sp. RKAG293 TaxID=2893403 RepID=UPI00203446D9|nr:hypothetical protein [Streptomyces sp. RKAG293]MCM2422824.1 hypothetical protein [Streptomyces sp. RKAG293]
MTDRHHRLVHAMGAADGASWRAGGLPRQVRVGRGAHRGSMLQGSPSKARGEAGHADWPHQWERYTASMR